MVKWGMLLTSFLITPALAVSSANVPVNPERPKIELKVQQDTQKANSMKVVTVLSGVGLFVHSIHGDAIHISSHVEHSTHIASYR